MRIIKCLLLLVVVLLLISLALSCQSSGSNTNQVDTTPSARLDLASIPLEQALSSSKPTLAEFGRGICVPCKAMKPILEELAVEYEGKLAHFLANVANVWKEASQEQRNELANTLFEQIWIEDNKVIGVEPREELKPFFQLSYEE